MTDVLCDAWCVERRRTDAKSTEGGEMGLCSRIARPLKRCTRL
jgi:hypothetical protein